MQNVPFISSEKRCKEEPVSELKYPLTVLVHRYAGVLFVSAVLLIAMHTGLYLYSYGVEELPWPLLQLFDLDEENNIPTWFSSFLLLNNAFFFYLYARTVPTPTKRYWLFLAGGLLLLACDEVAGLHETLNTAIDMNWAIPGGILVLVVGIVLIPFLWSLRRGFALLLFLSGALYVSGAIVVELLSEDMDSDSSAYALAVALEEGLEMLGALLCLTTILHEMKKAQQIVVEVSIA